MLMEEPAPPVPRRAQLCAYCKAGHHIKCTGGISIIDCDCKNGIHTLFVRKGEEE